MNYKPLEKSRNTCIHTDNQQVNKEMEGLLFKNRMLINKGQKGQELENQYFAFIIKNIFPVKYGGGFFDVQQNFHGLRGLSAD